MLPFPSRRRRPALAVAVLLALGVPEVSARPSWTVPTRGGATVVRAAARTEAVRAMAPKHYAVFFWRAASAPERAEARDGRQRRDDGGAYSRA